MMLTFWNHFGKVMETTTFWKGMIKVQEFNNERFRQFLSNTLQEKNLSIRKLSKLCGIDHATISKIMNGKRKINLKHLEKLAIGLDIELPILMKEAGYNMEMKNENASDIQVALENIQQLIESSNLYHGNFTLEKMEQEIVNYKNYSQTEEGKNTIFNHFNEKIQKSGAIGPYIQKMNWMYHRFIEEKGTSFQIGLMGGALLYFIVTTDLLPDYLFPIGYLDDALVVQTVSQQMNIKS